MQMPCRTLGTGKEAAWSGRRASCVRNPGGVLITMKGSTAPEAHTFSIPQGKGATMAGIGKHKLADSIPRPKPEPGTGEGGKPVPTPETASEQIREADESA